MKQWYTLYVFLYDYGIIDVIGDILISKNNWLPSFPGRGMILSPTIYCFIYLQHVGALIKCFMFWCFHAKITIRWHWVTRMWNMISSPATPTVCLEQKSENFQSRNVTLSMPPHGLENNCIWDNLQCCLLVPRSPSKPVMLTFDLQSRKVLFIEIVFLHV